MSLLILNFHGVGPVPRTMDSGEYNCWLDQDFFESVLDLVAGRPNVRITVDDGNESDFTIILPALRRRNLSATFFVCSGRLDQPSFLTRQQLLALSESGMEIGSHGVGHVSWRKLSPPELSHELQTSRSALQQICCAPIDSAACPFGDYGRNVLKHLRNTGYLRVFTSDGGYAMEGRWLVPRNTVTRSMSMRSLRRLIEDGPAALERGMIKARIFVKKLR